MAYGEVLWHTKADGWDVVDNDDLLAILKNTNDVPWGLSGIARVPICPIWVIDAMETYNKNGGFAGMSPPEYLDRVSNGKTQGPKHSF